MHQPEMYIYMLAPHIASVSRKPKQSWAIPIIDPITGKNVLDTLKEEKIKSSKKRIKKQSEPHELETITEETIEDLLEEMRECDTIHVSLQSVELNKMEKAWIPSHMKPKTQRTDEEELMAYLEKSVRGLLNKLTPENFIHLSKSISNTQVFPIQKVEHLMKVSNEIIITTV
jgi:hypothetical protein